MFFTFTVVLSFEIFKQLQHLIDMSRTKLQLNYLTASVRIFGDVM